MSSPPAHAPSPAVAEPPALTAGSGRILVVDDDPSSSLLLRAILKKAGYAPVAADSMEAAQRIFLTEGFHAFDGLITDYFMPGGTGLDLLDWLHARDPSLATVIVTAEHERQVIAQSMRRGACDFLDKPVSFPGLSAAAGRAIELTRLRRHQVEAESAAQHIGRIQQKLLQAELRHATLPITLYFRPRYEAGGDFLCRLHPAPQRHCVLLSDVSGHDLQAAYLSAYFQGLVRGMIEQGSTMKLVFDYFNYMLAQDWQTTPDAEGEAGANLVASISACAFEIDFDTRHAEVISCGSPLPIHVDVQGHACQVGREACPPLGWFPESRFTGLRLPITEHDSFLVWSDGVESHAANLGLNTVTLAAALLLSRKKIRPPLEMPLPADDLLAAQICLSPQAGEGYLPLFLEDYRGDQAGEIDQFQSAWERNILLCLPQLSDEDLFRLLLASREAMLNALKHGCAGKADNIAHFVISYHLATGQLRVFINDAGLGHDFDWEAHAQAAPTELLTEHRGLILIENLATRWIRRRNGANLIIDFAPTPSTH